MAMQDNNPNGAAVADDGLIYDEQGFIEWCVNRQGRSVGTVKSYVSTIRTVFHNMFDAEFDNPFHNICEALKVCRVPAPATQQAYVEEAWKRLEFEYESLVGYVETVEYEDSYFNDDCEMRPIPEIWVTALKVYVKFIRWSINRRRQVCRLPIKITEDKSLFIELPFSKEFRQYLKRFGKGYEGASVDSIMCRLRKLYNLCIRRTEESDFMSDLETCISREHEVRGLLDKVEVRIKDARAAGAFPELSEYAYTRGLSAFGLYRNFLLDYSVNPEKYPAERYTRPEQTKKTRNQPRENTMDKLKDNNLREWESFHSLLDSAERVVAQVVVPDMSNPEAIDRSLSFIKTMRDDRYPVIAIIPMPFMFEGTKTYVQALDALGEIRHYVDGWIILNESRYAAEIYDRAEKRENSIKAVYELRQQMIAEIIDDLEDLTSADCFVNVDMPDMGEVLKECGTLAITCGIGEGPGRFASAIAEALSTPALKGCLLNTARHLVMKFLVPAADSLDAAETQEIIDYTATLPRRVQVSWGIADEDYLPDGSVCLILCATGFDVALPQD